MVMRKFLHQISLFIVLCVASFSGHALEIGDRFTVDGLYYEVAKLDPPCVELVTPVQWGGYSGEITLRSSVSYEDVDYSVTFRSNVLSNSRELTAINFDPDFSAEFFLTFSGSTYPVNKITLPRVGVGNSYLYFSDVPSLIDATVVNDGKNQVFTIRSHNVRMYDGSLGTPYLLNNAPDYYTEYPERIYPDADGRLVVPVDPEHGAVYSTPLINGHQYILPLYFDTEGERIMVRIFVEMDNSGVDVDQDGLHFSIVNDRAVVRGFSETASSDQSGDVVIPASIDYSGKTYPVTKVSYGAFQWCKTLTSIDLGRINEIGVYAFSGCTALKDVEIPSSVKNIGKYAFYISGLERINFNSDCICECDFDILDGTKTVVFSESVSDDEMIIKVTNNIYYGNQVMPIKLEKDRTMYELDADGCFTLNKSDFTKQDNYYYAYVRIHSAVDNIITPYTGFCGMSIQKEGWEAGGVSDITVGDDNLPVEYYNLQGVRVAEPSHGLYIRRRGNVVDKVMVR